MKPLRTSLLLLLSTLGMFSLLTAATAGDNSPIANVQVVPAKLKLDPKQPTPFEVRFALKEGWHVNANPASDPHLKPTVLSVEDGTPFRLTEVSYPKGIKYEVEDEVIDIYEGTVVIKGKIQASSAPSKETTLKIEYQACNSRGICLPPAKLKLPVGIE